MMGVCVCVVFFPQQCCLQHTQETFLISCGMSLTSIGVLPYEYHEGIKHQDCREYYNGVIIINAHGI